MAKMFNDDGDEVTTVTSAGDLGEALAKMFGTQTKKADPKYSGNASVEAQVLRMTAAEFNETRDFVKGDIVTAYPWAIYSHPLVGQPAIVLELLETPVTDKTDSHGSPFFNFKCDMRIGHMQNGKFVCYYVDSRYFHRLPVDPV